MKITKKIYVPPVIHVAEIEVSSPLNASPAADATANPFENGDGGEPKDDYGDIIDEDDNKARRMTFFGY